MKKALDFVSDYQLKSACKDAICIAPSKVTQMIFAVLEDWYHHIVLRHSFKLVSFFYIYIKIWRLKDNRVASLTFWSHMTSSIRWPFDSRWSTSYGLSIVTMRLSSTVMDWRYDRLNFLQVVGQSSILHWSHVLLLATLGTQHPRIVKSGSRVFSTVEAPRNEASNHQMHRDRVAERVDKRGTKKVFFQN